MEFIFYNIFKGECIYIKEPNSDQKFIILDQDWFFDAVSKLSNLMTSGDKTNDVLEQSLLSNLTYLKNEYIKSSKFMDELNLADMQQVEYFFDLLNYFNLTMRIQTEKENLCVFSNFISKNPVSIEYYKNKV